MTERLKCSFFSNHISIEMNDSWMWAQYNLLPQRHRGSITSRTSLLFSHCVVSDSCATLWTCSPPDSSIHGIFQARILDWVAISFSRRSSRPRDTVRGSRIVSRHFTVWATREVLGTLWNKGSSQTRDETQVFCVGRWILYLWVTRGILEGICYIISWFSETEFVMFSFSMT